MGWFSDLLFGKKQKATYQGGRQMTDTYSAASQLQTPDYRTLMGQIGGGTLSSASKDYMTRVLSGEGENVYESDAFKRFEEATMGRTTERLGEVASVAGQHGLLRGSGSERMATDVVTEANRGLSELGFQAQQAGLERQYGIAQFAPQLEMQEQQMQAGLMQQGYQDLLSKLSLQGNLASSINQMYGVTQRSGGLLQGIGSVAGAMFGGPIGGAMAGTLFPRLFGGEQGWRGRGEANPAQGWYGGGK